MKNVITIAERLKAAREKLGLTQNQLARKAKVSQGTISNIENEIRNRPREILEIAKALNVSPEWLQNGIETQKIKKILPAHLESSQPIDEHDFLGHVETRLVPLKGGAKMGENGFYEIVDDHGCVDAYSNDMQAYALRVKGDEMHPAMRHGCIVIVEPSGLCTPGEYVVIHLNDDTKMIKELVIDRTNEIVVESVNGNQRQTIEKSAINQMHPIASIVSASKWRPN
jgi:phage repressor protein C with HTH and peptisase S24 domain